MNSINKTARIAGVLYFIYFIFFFIADKFGSSPVASADAAVTLKIITTSPWQFRIGFLSFQLAAVFFLLTAWALYVLLKPVNKNIALLFLLLNLGGVAVKCTSLIFEFAALQLLTGTDYLRVTPEDQLSALALFFLDLYENGFMIAQIFFGAWLLPLGYLVFKSGFLLRILGILLIIDFFCILIWFFQFFLFPGYDLISYPFLAVSFIAEFGFTLWLLIKGAKDKKPVPIEAS